jgi:hypothetical protein
MKLLNKLIKDTPSTRFLGCLYKVFSNPSTKVCEKEYLEFLPFA